MSNPLFNEETYWAPMGRCDRCGQFMKRGIFNWAEHLDVCKGKSREQKNWDGYHNYLRCVGPKVHEALCKAYVEYFQKDSILMDEDTGELFKNR